MMISKKLELLNQVGFINSFSFIFSARPGTPAFDLDKIDVKDAKNRLIEFQHFAKSVKKYL